MMDVPDEIRAAARKCIAEWGPRGRIGLDDVIAAALMAEREKAATIADAAELLNPDAGHAQVAAAIRRGTP